MTDEMLRDYRDWLTAKSLRAFYEALKEPLPRRYARLLRIYGTGIDPK